jgi:hypothetical protein
MFGPDRCGSENKVYFAFFIFFFNKLINLIVKFHFIIRFKNPITGTYEEKHAKPSEIPANIYSDGKSHLYTLGKRNENKKN